MTAWLTNKHVNYRIVDASNKLIYSHTNEYRQLPGQKTLFLKVDNNHVYPIQDKSIQQEISITKKIKQAKIDWKKDHIPLGNTYVQNVLSLQPKDKIIIATRFNQSNDFNDLASSVVLRILLIQPFLENGTQCVHRLVYCGFFKIS